MLRKQQVDNFQSLKKEEFLWRGGNLIPKSRETMPTRIPNISAVQCTQYSRKCNSKFLNSAENLRIPAPRCRICLDLYNYRDSSAPNTLAIVEEEMKRCEMLSVFHSSSWLNDSVIASSI
mmetsp:Transcript_12327/g.22281  ORF Transcript_12327/g.22281 Transcript_12327/m.22281 type:complete len:120 (+) Transcript_12327:663-1022(+)